jgi:hypothetical protein
MPAPSRVAPQRAERRGGARGVPADGGGGLHERLVDVVLDLAAVVADPREQLARVVAEVERVRLDEQQLLLHPQRERGLAAEGVLHGAGV